MASNTRLYSLVRPSKSSPKKVRGFLALPGEVRNQIYAYYFRTEFRCEVATTGRLREHEPKTVKLWAGAFQTKFKKPQYSPKAQEEVPLTVHISRALGNYNAVRGLHTKWSTSLFAINLVCKQLYAETLPFLYQKTVFVFSAPNRIINFVSVISKTKLAYITKLQLHYTTYGSPRLAEDRVWQDKHIKSWHRACSAISKKLTGLSSLDVSIRAINSPLRFNLREPWVLPLLQFRCLMRKPTPGDEGPNLKHVHVAFRSRLSGFGFGGNTTLSRASEDLHRLFGQAIELAVLGAKEEAAMAGFTAAWDGEHHIWQHHLRYGKTGW